MAAAQKEMSEVQRLAIERLARIERTERQVESLEQENAKLKNEMEALRQSEMGAISKMAILESRVNEREREIEVMLSRNNEQGSSTIQVLENLLAAGRATAAETSNRAEALSLQLQATQGKLDALHHELTSVRLNETALDSKLRTASHHGKHLKAAGSCMGTESVQDMDIDGQAVKGKTTSPLKYAQTEDGGSVFRGGKGSTQSQQDKDIDVSGEYTKFKISKLKQKLAEHGYGAELLQLKTPRKKYIFALYEKHVFNR